MRPAAITPLPSPPLVPPDFSRIDAGIVARAFDAELILRERRFPFYELLPAEPRDGEIVAAAGGCLVRAFEDPVVILENTPRMHKRDFRNYRQAPSGPPLK